jgi:hypothetical protein
MNSALEALRYRYIKVFGIEPSDPGEVREIELRLEVTLPGDFWFISTFYGGGMLGGISHHAISDRGPATNIVDETERIRKALGLNNDIVVLAEPPESLIVMDLIQGSDRAIILWLDGWDVGHLPDRKFQGNPQSWNSYSEFFAFLLDREADEE